MTPFQHTHMQPCSFPFCKLWGSAPIGHPPLAVPHAPASALAFLRHSWAYSLHTKASEPGALLIGKLPSHLLGPSCPATHLSHEVISKGPSSGRGATEAPSEVSRLTYILCQLRGQRSFKP